MDGLIEIAKQVPALAVLVYLVHLTGSDEIQKAAVVTALTEVLGAMISWWFGDRSLKHAMRNMFSR